MEGIHKMELQHFSHQHALFLREALFNPSLDCKICYSWFFDDSSYVCDKCRYYVHKRCAELPHHITHPFHPSHPLTLITNELPRDYICDSCHQDNYYTPWYRCDQCDFYMDAGCALMDPITCEDNQEHIQHFSHQHPMPLVNIDGEDEYTCFACHSTSSGPTYACNPCQYFLHKSCAELPREIQHPFHPRQHTMSLCVTHKDFHCKLCDKEDRRTFAVKCQQCSLWLCVECGTSTTTRPTIQFKGHEHLNFYFVERLHTKLGQCSAYAGYCKQQALSNSEELKRTCSSVLRCLECDYTLHLLCGPLPNIIKYEYHIHPLNLVDSIIEADDSDEFCCDICETERDPRICVYYCGDCKFIAHIHCVTSEVINVMKGIRGDHVELKIAADDVWQFQPNSTSEIEEDEQGTSTTTLKDLINQLTEGDKSRLRTWYKWEETSSKNKGQVEDSAQTSKLGDGDVNWILKLSRFTHKDFQHILREFNNLSSMTELELKPSDLELKIVKVQGYMIPQTLSPVFKTILHHHADVCSGSHKTPATKSFAFSILCLVVKRMCSTMVKDITRDLLQEWYHHLRYVKRMGFTIDFARAHLKTLVHVFLGLQAKRLEEEIPTTLRQRISELQQEIEDKKVKLEKCKEYGGSSAKSEFMVECLNKASEWKWKKACDHLFS